MSVCTCGLMTNGGRPMCDRCTALVAFGLTRDATQAEIKDAYRVLAKVWHPDRFQDDEHLRLIAEDKVKEINSAYQLLTTTSAEDTQTRPPGPTSQPEQSQPPAAAEASARQSPRPSTSHFNRSFSRKRRGNRMWLAVTFVLLLGVGAWLILRDSIASEFTTSTASGSASHQTASPVDNSRQTTVGNGAAPRGDIAPKDSLLRQRRRRRPLAGV
jgi:hypothetical protein